MFATALSFIAANYVGILVGILTIDLGLSRLFPNAKIFQVVAKDLKSAGIKDADGQ